METVAWIGALETAIAILYLALIGQRSIAQWLDDRRKQRTAAEKPDQEAPQKSNAKAPFPASPRSHARLLSVQSVGDYIVYVWRDPVEAGVVTAKALTLGVILLFGPPGLLLLLSAVLLSAVAFFSGSADLARVASQIAATGGNALAGAGLGIFLSLFTVWWDTELKDERKREQERREKEERERLQRKAAAERRRASQQ